MLLSIIIPTLNFNNRNEVFKLISKQSIKDQIELVLVFHKTGGYTNGVSIDTTVLDSEKIHYKIIEFNGIFNFSAMNNLGYTHSSGDYILFMNDDVFIEDSFILEGMVSDLEQYHSIGMLGDWHWPDESALLKYKEKFYIRKEISGHFAMYRRKDLTLFGEKPWLEECYIVASDDEMHWKVWKILNKFCAGKKIKVSHNQFSTRKPLFEDKRMMEIDKNDHEVIMNKYKNMKCNTIIDGIPINFSFV